MTASPAAPFTVCILAAGRGTRVGAFAGKLHKALLPVGNVAAITRIIRQFPSGTRFVVALGHLAAQVGDYLALMHPGLDVTLVAVDRVDGPGAGPGYSLACCRPALPGPFILTSCDTLMPGQRLSGQAPASLSPVIPPPDRNWIGVQPAAHPERWCTVDAGSDGQVTRLIDKSPEGAPLAFIGIAGVADAPRFWDGLAAAGVVGEAQVVPGLNALIPAGMSAVTLPWLDTGTDANYRQALGYYAKNHTFDGKTTDVTYEDDGAGGRVVAKLFFDPALTARRFARGAANRGVFANVRAVRGHLYAYDYAPGRLLSDGLDGPACRRVLDWLQARFWRPVAADRDAFAAACRQFYREKTLGRLDDYLARYAPAGEEPVLILNGRSCPPVRTLVAALPAGFDDGGLASTFHGDLHADNIVVREEGGQGSGETGGYVLIDWRDSFAGATAAGDRYYDLAKFFHTLDLSVAAMDAGAYAIVRGDDGTLTLSHHDAPALAAARAAFWTFVAAAGYDARRIAVINALVFVNMAPLYDRAMADYLYTLGRLRLAAAVDPACPPDAL